MSRIDTHRNSLEAHIVYWGPSASGKSEALAAVQRSVDPEGRSAMYSLAGSDGSTVYFDMLPLEEFRFGGHKLRVRVTAVPGGVDRGPERQALLRDADAVVFVADAMRSALAGNRAFSRELDEVLAQTDRSRTDLPVVWCFNKQDAPDAIPTRELREMLVPGTEPVYETVATSGTGVYEAFRETFRLLLQNLARRHELTPSSSDGDGMPEQLLPQLARAARAGGVRAAGAAGSIVNVDVPAEDGDSALRAVETMRALAELHADCAAKLSLVEGQNTELLAVNRVARSILSAMEIDNLLLVLLDATVGRLGVTHAGVVVFDPAQEGALKTHITGFGRDPALGLAPAAARRFFELMRDSDGPIPADSRLDPELLKALQEVDGRVKSAMFQPLKVDSSSPNGWIGIYMVEETPRMGASALLFLSSIARLAALGLEKIGQFDVMRRTQEEGHDELHDITANLEMARARVRALNRGLESRVRERTQVLTESLRRVQRDSAESVIRAREHGVAKLAASLVSEMDAPLAGLTARLDEMRGQLHELRGKIAAGTPEERVAALAKYSGGIDACIDEAKRVDGVVGSLRSKDADRPDDAGFSLNSAVTDAAALLERRIEGAAEFDLRLGTLPDVPGDAAALGELVSAILTNALEAVEATGKRGTITVTTYGSSDSVTLRITDDGVGIDEDLLPRVCEPYVTTKQGQKDAGLGLHAAQQSIEAQGGSLSIKARSGGGTSATVEFALATQPA